MSAWFCRVFGWWCPKPLPIVVPPIIAPTARCAMGCVAQRGAGDIAGMVALGAKIVRVTFYTAQDTPQYRTDIASWLTQFDAAGIEPVIVVHDFQNATNAPAMMASLVASFPNRTWQVGNEYNGQPWREKSPGWGPGSTTGTFYAGLMQQVVAACSAARFVGMGLAFNFAQAQFLADYIAGGGPTLEAWCIHVYGCPYNANVTVPETTAVLQGKMPLWITEYGIEEASMVAAWGPQTLAQCDAEQCKEMAALLAVAGSLGVSRTYYYCYWDDTDTGFGLVRKDESHRPAWDSLHAACAR